MFDDDDGFAVNSIQEAKPQQGYQKQGFQKFARKKEEVTDIPYVAVAFFIDKDFPHDVKSKLYGYINKLISKNVIIRINGDDKEFIDKLKNINYDKLEIYIPWKGFNDIDSKLYFNTETCKLIATKYMPAWDKLPSPVQALLSRNARLLFGDKNNSCVGSLITWSPDGASRVMEIGKTTGRSSHVIRMALSNYISLLNVQKENSDSMFEKVFKINE